MLWSFLFWLQAWQAMTMLLLVEQPPRLKATT